MVNSLRHKIIVGFAAVAAFVVGLSLLAAYELWRVERAMAAEEAIAAVVDAVADMRRFEKNYLLYRDGGDLQQSRSLGETVAGLLVEHADTLSGIDGSGLPDQLRARLALYVQALDACAAAPGAANEAALRGEGKALTVATEQLAASRRAALHRATGSNRMWVLGIIVGCLSMLVATGYLLRHNVTRPLAAVREHLDSEKLASLRVMLSGIAHELNNPLSNISSSVQILIEEQQPDPEFVREHLAQMDEQTERARRIVASVLDLGRSHAARKQPVPLGPLVEETLALVRASLPASAAIDVHIPAEFTVPADNRRLQQALINLVRNAAEAIGPGGRIAIRAREEGGEALIEVSDNGCGIKNRELARVFEPFFSTKEVGKGTGLGLFIVHDIIAKHGGRITVTSTPGQGTSFLIRLPLGDNSMAVQPAVGE
ncbi:sensor histidine kinase [Magnetospirillum sp. UT-4]|uniref:sensor histidine kinase n=1 Tax=Magnetospirillum sp. UT-4 TaxID=2681467 RepID=UPI00137D83A5|nr:ATP-binding protein [Magnetospirillum sp. UT-4]CAA7611711.1 putative Sensor protein [Magnetospirillum sp. UT-4]